MKKILTIVAHPDDEILGCGGTIARLVRQGYQSYTLILGEGITSRDEKREREKREKEIKKIREHAYKANGIIGVKEVFIYDFPDNRFDTVPLLNIVKVIEEIKNKIKPDVIYTHHRADLNIDHRITYQAVLTACRPITSETVKEIYSFETPSSTEWNYPNSFNPNVFIEITQTIDRKIEALRCYESEIKESPHPRSEELIRGNAKRWGGVAGLKNAEAFEAIRIVIGQKNIKKNMIMET
jgi:LmbE family N-acetylglucosaminyl deacetylase